MLVTVQVQCQSDITDYRGVSVLRAGTTLMLRCVIALVLLCAYWYLAHN